MKERIPIAKRVFFGGFSMKHLEEVLTQHLEQYEYEFVGHISLRNYLKHPEVTFFLQRDCYRKPDFLGNPDDILPPPEIIKHMKFAEIICLKMMDRNHKNPFPHRRYENRKRVYLGQLALAYSILTQHRIEQVFFSILPHNTFDYILHHLAKHLGIPSHFLYQIQVIDTFFVSDDIANLYGEIPEKLDPRSETTLPKYLEEEILLRSEKTKPFYMTNQGMSLKEVIYKKQKRIFRIHSYIQPFYAIGSFLAYKALPKIKEPPTQRFIYFALHFQPEATTSPMGGTYVDQHLAILTIARAIPDDMVVVIKEHPAQFYWQRYPDFYRIMAKQKNIVFANRDLNTHELIEKAFAVATITGTVAWEAVFAQKAVLLFGQIFCESIKGIYRCASREDVGEAIRLLEEDAFEFATPADIRDFLLRLQQATHIGITDECYFRNSSLPEESSIRTIGRILEERVALAEPARANLLP